jgi:hypothetical protein
VSGNTIAFDLPATIAQLDFVDISVAGAWSHILRSSLTIVGSRVTATLPSAIAGEVLIFSRYDAFSGNSNAGFYRIVV